MPFKVVKKIRLNKLRSDLLNKKKRTFLMTSILIDPSNLFVFIFYEYHYLNWSRLILIIIFFVQLQFG